MFRVLLVFVFTVKHFVTVLKGAINYLIIIRICSPESKILRPCTRLNDLFVV